MGTSHIPHQPKDRNPIRLQADCRGNNDFAYTETDGNQQAEYLLAAQARAVADWFLFWV